MQPLSAYPRGIYSKMPRPRPWSLMLNKLWCARFKTSTGSGWCGFFWILHISIPFLNWRFSKPLVGWISYPIIFSWFRNSDPVSLHEGWRGFLFGNLFVKIITNWKFLAISKTMLSKLLLVSLFIHLLTRNSDRIFHGSFMPVANFHQRK